MSTSPSRAPNRRGPRPRFTREQVLSTALRLIDEGQPGTFTMRQLADEMGMGVMTLYGYVSNKEELYEAVTLLVFGESPDGEPPGQAAGDRPWHEQVRTAVRELHDICRQHPNLLTIVLADRTPAPGLFKRRERILTALRGAGLPPDTALHALGTLISFAVGFAVAQGSAVADPPDHLSARQHADLPSITAAGAGYPSHLAPAAFDYGLDLLIDGLRGSAPG